MTKRVRMGIIGCGFIGTEIARVCAGALRSKIILTALYDIDPKKIEVLERRLGKKLGVGSLDRCVEASDFLVEAASGAVSADLLKLAVRMRKHIMIMSTGGLIGKEELLETAEKRGIKVFLPSGAVAGLDALKAAMRSKVDSVTLTTRKPPGGLKGAPYLIKRSIILDNIRGDKTVFEGRAAEAVKEFPKNINVSALLSLAGIGAAKTRVKIIACPGLKRNIHEVEIKGRFGVIRTVTENVPSPENPKTSFLAALSAIATLKDAVGSVRVGT